MKTTYEIKQTADGTDYLEMTTPEGTVSHVPMDESNSDYQAYLNKDNPEYGKLTKL